MRRENICFHEAGVLEFTKVQTSIKLELENVLVDGQIKNVELSFIGIKTLEVEHNPAQFPLMAAEFGEIVFLELNDNKAELLILWHQFSPRPPISFEKFYFIDCEQIDIKITDPEMSPEFLNVKKEDLSFHETLVLKFTRYPSSILLSLEGAKVGKQCKYVELLFEGIKRVEVNNEPLEADDKQTEYSFKEKLNGKIHKCELNNNKVTLLIEWNDSVRDLIIERNVSVHDIQLLKLYFIEFDKLNIKVI